MVRMRHWKQCGRRRSTVVTSLLMRSLVVNDGNGQRQSDIAFPIVIMEDCGPNQCTTLRSRFMTDW